jgi:hypothetical protein
VRWRSVVAEPPGTCYGDTQTAMRILHRCAWPSGNIQTSGRDFLVQRGNETVAAVVDVGVVIFPSSLA